MGDFRQRVVLVHELRQLRGAEEFLHRRSNGLGVDQFLRRQAFGLGHRQALLDRALDADKADAERVLGHFTDRTHATVAEVVDVIDGAATVADLGQYLDRVEDVRRVAEVGDAGACDSSSLRSAKYLASYSTEAPVTSLRPMRRLNFIRPTPDRS